MLLTPPARHGPIGVFDSGLGGLSVWREIVQLMPQEPTLYLADQAHAPYGPQPREQVEARTHRAVAWLLEQGAKLVVIACNTASAAALESLRARWPHIPIVGMEPAVKPATQATRTGHVGVLATAGALHAPRFSRLVERFANGVRVHTVVGEGLVEMIEKGQWQGPEVESHLQKLLAPLQAIPIDHLVLGCTHFPFLALALTHVLGPDVRLVNPAPAVARQTQRMVWAHDLARPEHTEPGPWRFVTTGPVKPFRELVHQLVAPQLATISRPLSFEHLSHL